MNTGGRFKASTQRQADFIPNPIDNSSMDQDYDQSKLGPGTYDHFSTFSKENMQSKVYSSKRPSFSFGLAKRTNDR